MAQASVSAQLAAYPAYDWRTDPAVPRFEDTSPLIVYDGVCILCSRGMRAIARSDVDGKIHFASAQSPLGQALFGHYRLDPQEFDTVLLLSGGRAFGKLDVAHELARLLGGCWRMFGVFSLLPRGMQDLAYDLIAKNRYRLFGRTEICMLPDPSFRARVIDDPK